MKKPWVFYLIGFGAVAIVLSAFAVTKAIRAVASSRTGQSISEVVREAEQPGDKDGGSDAVVIRFAKNPEAMPPFLVNDLDGSTISTANLHGKVVLLSFWATWCGPCREEIPELNTLADRYKGQLQVVGISEDDDPADQVHAFAKRMDMRYPVMMASKQITDEFGEVPALPTSYLVNTDGGIVQKHVGLYPIEVYDREIRALLKMPVDAKIETFEDTGQIFLKNAARATALPGVDFSGLTPEQRKAALKRMNSENCTCGCKLTVAQCRINEETCETSKKIAGQIVSEIRGKIPPPTSQTIQQ